MFCLMYSDSFFLKSCMLHTTILSTLYYNLFPWRRKWELTPVFFPGKFCGQRSLAGYSPWGRKELDMAEHTCSIMLYLNISLLFDFLEL